MSEIPSSLWRLSPTMKIKRLDVRKLWSYSLYYLSLRALRNARVEHSIKLDADTCVPDERLEALIKDEYHDNRKELLILCLDRVLSANGYPSIRSIVETAYSILESAGKDTVVFLDDFARLLGVEPASLVTPLSILWANNIQCGIYLSTRRKPIYKVTYRDIKFDSLFLYKNHLQWCLCKSSGWCFRNCYEDIKARACRNLY